MSIFDTPILDDFNRGDEGPPPSNNWSGIAGIDPVGLGVVGGTCQLVLDAGGVTWNEVLFWWNITKFGPNSRSFVDLVTLPSNGNSAYLYVQLNNTGTGSPNGYALVCDIDSVGGDTITLFRLDTGWVNEIQLDSFSVDLNDGDSVCLQRLGQLVIAHHKPAGGNWVEVGRATDTTYNEAGYIGTGLFDDGVLGNFGGGGDAATGLPPTTRSFHQSRQLSIIAQDPLYLSTRTYSRRITPLISRYSHEIRSIGGYYSASITLHDSIRRLEEWAARGLGRHIAVYNPSLCQIWEGFINQITITEGGEQFNLGPLIDVGNRVTAAYSPVNATVAPPVSGSRTMTAVGNNTNSQGLYGIWEKIVGVNQVTATEAAQLRDVYLNDPTRVYPDTSLDSSLMGGGGLQVELQCLGYWHFLTGYYYANAAATGYVSVTTKIQSVLAASPNAGVFSTDYSQIATNATLVKAYDGGDRTAETILKDVNGLGDSSFNSYTIGFYNNRRLVYQPVPTAIEYQRRATGNRGIINKVNREIMPWNVLPARWIFRPDFLVGRFPPVTAASLGSDPRAAFIEVVQFDAPYSLSINGRKLSQLDQVLSRRGLGGAA